MFSFVMKPNKNRTKEQNWGAMEFLVGFFLFRFWFRRGLVLVLMGSGISTISSELGLPLITAGVATPRMLLGLVAAAVGLSGKAILSFLANCEFHKLIIRS